VTEGIALKDFQEGVLTSFEEAKFTLAIVCITIVIDGCGDFGLNPARITTQWLLDPRGTSINRGGDLTSPPHHRPHHHITTAISYMSAPNSTLMPSAKEATSKSQTLNPSNNALILATTGGSDHAGSSSRRKDKQIMKDTTEEVVPPIIVNMAKARGVARVRLLAVGVFLSVIAITSRHLINYMRNIWKVRGNIETHQLADRRFVIEFYEEGDFEHVTCGGPWRYKDDAVLVRKLKEGEDPETAQFDSVPIWVQYKGIPFYLLTKALARDLGRRTGGFICIDNNARGDICDKILRARVLLPLGRPLL
jgi:hypothetical protein